MTEADSSRGTPKKRRRGCVVLLVFSVIFLGSYAILFFHDPSTIDDADLRLPPLPALDDPSNGAQELILALEELTELEGAWGFRLERFAEGELYRDLSTQAAQSADADEFRDHFVPLPEALLSCWRLLERAIESPTIAIRDDLPALPDWSVYFALVLVQFHGAWLEGDSDRAIEVLRFERELTRKFLESPSGFHYGWAEAWREHMGPVWRQVIARADSEGLAKLQRALGNPLLDREWASDMERGAYVSVSGWLEDVEAVVQLQSRYTDVPEFARSAWFYRPGRTKSQYAKLVRWRRDAILNGRSLEDAPVRTTAHQWLSVLAGNPLGDDLLARLAYPISEEVLREMASVDAILSTFIALERFRDDYGALPANLEALVPNYLPEVPKNPLSPEMPLHYQTAPPNLAALFPENPRTIAEERFCEPGLFDGESILPNDH